MSDAIQILTPLEQEGSKSVVRAWLKKVGDAVTRDEPIVELETDKVAVEVPSPADGVLASISLTEGDEAAPGALLGMLNAGAVAQAAPRTANPPMNAPRQRVTSAVVNGQREARLSPLVRRLISDNGLDAVQIAGTGRDGRITHEDVEAHIRERNAGASVARRIDPEEFLRTGRSTTPQLQSRRIPHDTMRKSIAEHMAKSLATAPHVTAVFEADFSAIAAHRVKYKDAYAKAGAPLTYSAYIVRAAAEAMPVSPNVNARWHDDALEVHGDVNIGMGVALGDKGLIVPVIRNTEKLTLKQTAAALGDVTERARNGKLKPADTQGGTFTISNHGVSGSLIAAPIIINQGQSAILGVGKLEKRVVVREIGGSDAIVVRPMAYVSLSIDHRVLDGHQTNAWLTRFVEVLETWPLEDAL